MERIGRIASLWGGLKDPGALLAIITLGVVGATPGPAPWDPDRVRAMFVAPLKDTTGLQPVWSVALLDSGRRIEVVSNHFRESASGRFPLDSIEARRFTIRGSRERGEEMVMEAAHGIIGVAADGSIDSTAIRWVTPPPYPVPAAGPFAGVGPVPRDGSLYCLSGNGKFLLVLRLSRAVNVWGETGSFGLLDYFDVSNPKRPRRIGPTLEADGPLHNGAVSLDGSRIAVQILLPAAVGWLGTRVVAFERTRSGLSAAQVVVPRTTAEGLQFVGRFLFVGMERSRASDRVAFSSTETISLFDLGE